MLVTTRDEVGDGEPQIMENIDKDTNKRIPTLDINSSIDRRKQSNEGLMIMADTYNQNSSSLSIGVPGVASTGDNEYDSGKTSKP